MGAFCYGICVPEKDTAAETASFTPFKFVKGERLRSQQPHSYIHDTAEGMLTPALKLVDHLILQDKHSQMIWV